MGTLLVKLDKPKMPLRPIPETESSEPTASRSLSETRQATLAGQKAMNSKWRLDWSGYMARAQAGDKDAYRQLLQDVAPYIRSIAARHFQNRGDIEDAVQDIFLTVHTIRHTYDPDRPFGPWLAAIANRRIVDCLRRQGRSRSREVALEEHDVTISDPGANLEDARSDGRALHEAVQKLPKGQREAIQMLKLQELSLKEASVTTGMSVAALKVATHRGLKNLKSMFGREPK